MTKQRWLTSYVPFHYQVKLTLLLALVAVPINTVFGIVAAIQLTRNEFWGKTLVMSMLDLPFSISPVVTGAQHAQSSPAIKIAHGDVDAPSNAMVHADVLCCVSFLLMCSRESSY